MPISFACGCGRKLTAADEHAGRRVKCPNCQAVAVVPSPADEDGFEVVDDAPPPMPVVAKRAVKKPAEDDFEVVDDEPDDRPRRKAAKREEDDDDEDDDRPRRKRKKVKEKPRSIEGKVLNGGAVGGLIAMVIAVVWFIVGLCFDILFWYPPVLFILGLIGLIKGAASGGDD